ncbi:MAG: zinc ribbon domain-containing protein [Gemmatimonadetes bacterium]|nr:zinc ribbon domain-containing protein [Gemmatimonadota bacterium]
MPLYEYSCRTCGTAFERRLKYEERLAPQTCPACGNSETVLRLSTPALVGSAAEATGVCPTSGNPCGCAHAVHN